MAILNWRMFFVFYRVEFLCILAFAFVFTLTHLSFACEDHIDWTVLTCKPVLFLLMIFVWLRTLATRNKCNPVCTSICAHSNAFLVNEAVHTIVILSSFF